MNVNVNFWMNAECVLIYILFYQISAWVFLIHMFLYAGFYMYSKYMYDVNSVFSGIFYFC